MRKQFQLGFSLSILLIMVSCGEDSTSSVSNRSQVIGLNGKICTTTGNGNATSSPTFSISDRKKVDDIVSSHCVSCHEQGGSSPNLSTLGSTDANKAAIVSSVASGKMPKGSALQQADKDLIAAWGKIASTSLQLAAPITYNDNIKALLTSNCVGCHGPNAQFPDLSTYATAKAAATSANADIQGQANQMPKAAPLSTTDKALFQNWVNGGLLESAPVVPNPPTPSPMPAPTPTPMPAPTPAPAPPATPVAPAPAPKTPSAPSADAKTGC